MTLEQQVCSLDLAKRLKELGVKQESLFWWIEHKTNGLLMLAFKTDVGFYRKNGAGFSELCQETCNFFSAPTSAELGEMIPVYINKEGHRFLPRYWKVERDEKESWICDGQDVCCFSHRLRNWLGAQTEEPSEANCRAKMLIYLLEQKLITI